MSKISLIIIGLILSLSLGRARGQELEVESFEHVVMDLTARMQPKVDANGRKCGVLKIYVNDEITEARGNVIGEVKDNGFEKMIYFSHDTKKLELLFRNHKPLHINFIDYGFPTISGEMTYILNLREKNPAIVANNSHLAATARKQESASARKQLSPQSTAKRENSVDTKPKATANPERPGVPGAPSANKKVNSGELSQSYSTQIVKEIISAYNLENYEKAMKLCQSIPDNPYAQTYIGQMYEKGQGVTQDYSEAAAWYRKAAEQDYGIGQRNLGVMYFKGLGVPQNYSEAVNWYKKASENGDAMASYSLGIMYQHGQGVDINYPEALAWYKKAVDQGQREAFNNIGVMYDQGQGVPQNYSEAIRWYRRGAEKGDATAQSNLGYMYLIGKGVKENYPEAAVWYRKAAEQGFADAQANLGIMYLNGWGVKKNKLEAVSWLSKAASQGNQNARELLNKIR